MQRGRSGNRAQVKEATPTEIRDILNFSGRVLTAPGEDLEVAEDVRRVVAIFENGTVIATKADMLDPRVVSARTAAERRGIRIARTLFVDLDVIRRVYQAYSSRSSSYSGAKKDVTRMEKDFLALVREAANLNASDIYIQVERFEADVAFRVNGVIQPVRQIPADYAHDMLGAAFAMSRDSDASYQRYQIQSTRVSDVDTILPEGVQALRLQFTPLSDGGRYLVARLLYSQQHVDGTDVDMLGYAQQQVEAIKIMRNKPYGVNVIAGPTGSGKSTTLQLTLSAQMEEKNNQIRITTIEDPPEYTIRGASQFPILNAATDEERREKFRQAISSALRSAPDIIMVGEIRDRASASLLFEAAMTGHQAWTTVHANNAISIIDRFRDWDVEDFKLTDETLVTGLIGQRLIRVICPSCRIPFNEARKMKGKTGLPFVPEKKEKLYRALFGDDVEKYLFFNNPEGCDHAKCSNGYIGRTVIAEIILPDATFMDLIRSSKKRDALSHWKSRLNGILMLEHVAAKVVAGIVDVRDAENRIGSFVDLEKERLHIVHKISKEYLQGA